MNSNITPPICKIKPIFTTVEVSENPKVIKAMRDGYSGTGDYYGNIIYSNKIWITEVISKIWRRVKKKLK